MENTRIRERVSPKETIKVKVVDLFEFKDRVFEVWKRDNDFSSHSFTQFSKDK